MRHTPTALLALGVALAMIYFSPLIAVLAFDEPDQFSADAEYEALIVAFDALDLSLDDPEFHNMDNGELWAVIEAHAKKERGRNGQAQTSTTD